MASRSSGPPSSVHLAANDLEVARQQSRVRDDPILKLVPQDRRALGSTRCGASPSTVQTPRSAIARPHSASRACTTLAAPSFRRYRCGRSRHGPRVPRAPRGEGRPGGQQRGDDRHPPALSRPAAVRQRRLHQCAARTACRRSHGRGDAAQPAPARPGDGGAPRGQSRAAVRRSAPGGGGRAQHARTGGAAASESSRGDRGGAPLPRVRAASIPELLRMRPRTRSWRRAAHLHGLRPRGLRGRRRAVDARGRPRRRGRHRGGAHRLGRDRLPERLGARGRPPERGAGADGRAHHRAGARRSGVRRRSAPEAIRRRGQPPPRGVGAADDHGEGHLHQRRARALGTPQH